MKHVTKWNTIVEYVDIETGEIISKSNFERNYYRIRSTKSTEIKEVKISNEILNYGYVKYTSECRRKPKQGKLF